MEKLLKPSKLCHNCFKPHQQMGLYCPQCEKLNKTMEIITKEQFDSLQVGDTLKNDRYTLSVEAKFANTIIVLDNDDDCDYLSFKKLQERGYSITKPIQHNCGFPYGYYSDREVVVKVSDVSIVYCECDVQYTRLISVSEKGFIDHNGSTWKFAVLFTNNVDLVKP